MHGGAHPRGGAAATDGAAKAVGRGGRVGRLAPGAAWHLVVLAGRSYLDLAYHLGVNLAERVVKGRIGGGRPLTESPRLVECVPNVSEGRRPEVVDEIVAAFAGADPRCWCCCSATPTTTGPSSP